MKQAVILGAGVMGAALTVPLAENGVRATIVGTPFDAGAVTQIQQTGYHPALQQPLPVGTTAVLAESSPGRVAEAFGSADLVVVGVASAGAQWAAEQLRAHLRPDTAILTVTKGLTVESTGTVRTIKHVFTDALPTELVEATTWVAACGPSIAGEVADRVDTVVLFAGTDGAGNEATADLFRTDRYHVRTSTDEKGAEVCAATKNLFALAVGYGEGLGDREQHATPSGDQDSINAGAALFTQALLEMRALVHLVGGNPKTVDGLAGTGDLFVTCAGGRNVRAGRFLGGGATVTELRDRYMPGETVEGLAALEVVGAGLQRLAERGFGRPGRFPLTEFLYSVVIGGRAASVPWGTLLD